MKFLSLQLHSNHEPTVERFIRSMASSGWILLSRRDGGLPWLSFQKI